MFNTTRNATLKDNASEFIDHARSNVADVVKETKSAARRISSKVGSKSKQTSKDAHLLLDSLREILDPREKTSKIDQVTEELVDQLSDWKDIVQKELSYALKSGTLRSRRFVQKRSLLALSLAVGTGVVIGYYLAGSSTREVEPARITEANAE